MRRGRPTKLTPALQARVCKLIRAGNFRTVAAAGAGVPMRTFSAWLAKGKSLKSGVYREFRLALIEAEKLAEIDLVAIIFRAAKKDARHACWWLERKYPARWGRKDRPINDETIDRLLCEQLARLASAATPAKQEPV
jgi:hypothetical protein